jgi:hypothetical protein
MGMRAARAFNPANVSITGGSITGTNVPYVVGRSGAAVTSPLDTVENVMATITIPANAMGPNGFIRVTTQWSATNNANVKTLRVRHSGASGNIYSSINIASTLTYTALAFIINRNSASSQIGGNPLVSIAGGGTAPTTGSVDTTAATTIVISAQKVTGTDAMVLEWYVVEVVYGA